MSRLAATVAALLMLAGVPAGAQGLAPSSLGGSEPIRVDASDGIEWRREDRVFIARGDARAVQGETVLRADSIAAYYREPPAGGTEIFRIEALGNVRIESGTGTAVAREGVYDLDREVMVLRGDEVRVTTPEEQITAHEAVEFHNRERVAVARGDVHAVQGNRRVRADSLRIRFRDGPNGRLVASRLEADGEVTVTMPGEVARARRGVYDLDAGTAELSGDVRITQGRNQLNGAHAHVDLNSGVSRLTAAPGGDGRVQALIVPGGRRGPSRN